jgi:hypothetical protein
MLGCKDQTPAIKPVPCIIHHGLLSRLYHQTREADLRVTSKAPMDTAATRSDMKGLSI